MLDLPRRRSFPRAGQRARRARRRSLPILPRRSLTKWCQRRKLRRQSARSATPMKSRNSGKAFTESGGRRRSGRAQPADLLPRARASDSNLERYGFHSSQEKSAGHLRLLSQQPAVSLAAQNSIRASRGTLPAKRAWTSDVDGDGAAATCSDCHGSHGILPSQDARSKVNHFNIPATCGQCHTDIAKTYLGKRARTSHESRRGQGAPVCSDCHGEHLILAPKEARIAGERDARLDGHLRALPQR
jgi:cytochrome c553